MSDNESETTTDEENEDVDQYLDEEQTIWAQNLLEDLNTVRDASERVIPKVESLLDEEITVSEYEEYVEENEQTFKDVRI